jgi:hypothetical protein
MKLSSAIIMGVSTLRFEPGDIDHDILGAAANAIGLPSAGDSIEALNESPETGAEFLILLFAHLGFHWLCPLVKCAVGWLIVRGYH